MKTKEVMTAYNIKSIIYDIMKWKGQLTINYGNECEGPFHVSDTESTQISAVGQGAIFTAMHSK